MPNGAVALVIAAVGLSGLLLLQLPGWMWLWRHIRGWTQRLAFLMGVGTVQVPFAYGLFVYKAIPMALPVAVWYVAWAWALAGTFVGLGLSLWRMFERLRARRQERSVGVQGRRQFLRFALLGGASLVASTQLVATTRHRRGHVEFVELPVVGLPSPLEGFTIGVISDIHAGPFMQRQQLEGYRRELEELRCELIVLPGDFIINRTAEIYPVVEAFAGLQAPLGVFAITGNHDYFSGEVEQICRELEQAGMRLLRNEAITIERDGAAVTLAGLDDFYARALPDYVERGWDPDGVLSYWQHRMGQSVAPRIVLCHRPYYFEPLVLLGADAVIAGHTHGGQIVLAEFGHLNLSPAAMVSPYVAGTYWSKFQPQRWMYVTRGIGTVGIPIRWNAPPEITHIRLVPVRQG